MKTVIYIEDGTVQLVITPETEFEKNSLSTFREQPINAKLFAGSFYDCRGGWIKQTALQRQGQFTCSDPEDSSLIIRVDNQEEKDEKDI